MTTKGANSLSAPSLIEVAAARYLPTDLVLRCSLDLARSWQQNSRNLPPGFFQTVLLYLLVYCLHLQLSGYVMSVGADRIRPRARTTRPYSIYLHM
jgi:hypothetical protein